MKENGNNGRFNLQQSKTKTIISIHEDRRFHSKMFRSDTDEVKDSAESREFEFVHQVGSPPPPVTSSRCSNGGYALLWSALFHHWWQQ